MGVCKNCNGNGEIEGPPGAMPIELQTKVCPRAAGVVK